MRREARAGGWDDGLMISFIKRIYLLLTTYRVELVGKALWKLSVWRVGALILPFATERGMYILNGPEQSNVSTRHPLEVL